MTGYTPITDGFDWRKASIANELFLAFIERFTAVSLAVGSFPSSAAVGGDAQAPRWVGGLQRGIDGQFPPPNWTPQQTWLDTTVPTNIAGFDGVGGPPNGWGIPGFPPIVYLTQAAWKVQSGLTANMPDVDGASTVGGWRRATTWPADWTNYSDPAYSYGYAQPGDIVGPWISQDLRTGMQPFQWMQAPVAFGNHGAGCGKVANVYVTGNWAAAQAALTAAWPADPLPLSSYGPFAPLAYMIASQYVAGHWSISAYRAAMFIDLAFWVPVYLPPRTTPYDVDFYFPPAAGANFPPTFGADGDPVKNGLWSLITHLEDQSGSISQLVGNLSLPDWCAAPAVVGSAGLGYMEAGSGFNPLYTSPPLAIVKWRFAFSL